MHVMITLTKALPGQPEDQAYMVVEDLDAVTVSHKLAAAARRMAYAELDFVDGGTVFVNPLQVVTVQKNGNGS